MGKFVAGPVTKMFAGIGLAILLAMAANTAFVTLPNKVKQYREKQSDIADVANEAEAAVKPVGSQ